MIKKEEMQKIADLARITLGDEEKESLRGEIDAILSYVSEIDKASERDTDPVLPKVHNIMREDGEPHQGGVFTESILDNVPNREGDYIKVKRILE